MRLEALQDIFLPQASLIQQLAKSMENYRRRRVKSFAMSWISIKQVTFKALKSILNIWLLLLALYLVTYFTLSGVSLAYMRKHGFNEFYYVPCDLSSLIANRKLEYVHGIGIVLFYPIWAVDHFLFGGPEFATDVPLIEVQ